MATAKQTRRVGNGATGTTTALPATVALEGEQLAQLPEQMPGTEIVGADTQERRERELEEILQELGNDSRIRVYHVLDGRSMFAGELSVEGFTLDALLDNFGGGEKTLKIYQGRNLVSTQRIPLDPTIPATSPRQKRLEAEKAMRPGGGGLGDMASLISAMGTAQLAQVSNTQSMLQMMQKQSQDAQQQNQSTMALMITALTGMFQAMKPAATPQVDPLEMLTKAAELMRPKDEAAGGIEKLLTFFDRGMRVGQAVGSNGEGDSVLPIVAEGIKGLTSLAEGIALNKRIEAARVAAPTLPPGQPLPPVPVYLPTPAAPPYAGPVNQQQPPAVEPQPDAKVAGTIMPTNLRPWLVKARAMRLEEMLTSPWVSKMPADAAAATIISNLDDDELDDLMTDVFDETAPTFGGRLVEYFPGLQGASETLVVWLQGVITGLIEQTTPDPDSENDEDESAEAGEPQALIDAARAAAREKGKPKPEPVK